MKALTWRRLLSFVVVAATGLAAASVAASPAQASELATDSASSDVIADALATMEATYTEPSVVRRIGSVQVDFDDIAGNHYSYEFDTTKALVGTGIAQPDYQTSWYWWGWRYWLNRSETRQLATDGYNAAILYAIGAALGCTACILGAAIEGAWASAASAYYSRGNCIYINEPYQTVGEHHSHGC